MLRKAHKNNDYIIVTGRDIFAKITSKTIYLVATYIKAIKLGSL